MSKVFLYLRGQPKDTQRAKLQDEFPQGETVIDRQPPDALEKLISEAGPGDLIATVNIYYMPGITAETYKTLCSKGVGLHFQQQPHLNSSVFSSNLEAGGIAEETAAAILQKQLDIEADRQKQQRAKEKAGRTAAAAAGRKGGRRAGERLTTKKETRMKVVIKEMILEGKTEKQIVDILEDATGERHLSHNTTYKYLRELKAAETTESQ